MTPDDVFTASEAFVGREQEFFRFLCAMRFLDYANRSELQESAAIFRVLSLVFAIEGIAPVGLGNQERVARFLVRYLNRDEKMTLLPSYLFTAEYPLGGESAHQRHLMFPETVADVAFRQLNFLDEEPQYCSTGPHPLCFCSSWLREQPSVIVDNFARVLGEKLYQMRCAVVHDATPVVFGGAQDERPPDVAVWSFTLVDAFTVRGGGYVMYETGLLVPDIVRILTNGLRRCFEDGARF